MFPCPDCFYLSRLIPPVLIVRTLPGMPLIMKLFQCVSLSRLILPVLTVRTLPGVPSIMKLFQCVYLHVLTVSTCSDRSNVTWDAINNEVMSFSFPNCPDCFYLSRLFPPVLFVQTIPGVPLIIKLFHFLSLPVPTASTCPDCLYLF